ncbi:hypothetical protein C7W88_02425 [Novosphingobium sp. THN1]|uniref:hypothetical protein n=1 Tax=unclassified Novosphingobium TaxID=2644732 RepID=UPI000E50BB88|nr:MULTISPECIES: hypothetical protein [unclassified Novosphingobium]AXU18154.1 hypothetical protein C7W88_02425 [Novosphingobium sp. THN1]NLR37963.1 hypothetical protein [Novosphingobium sp. ERW19]
MSASKPLASLSPSLLARKGAARPAMRPQLAISYEEQSQFVSQDDLGWNDLGEDIAEIAAPAQMEQPVVVQQIESLAEKVAAFAKPAQPGEFASVASVKIARSRVKGGKPVRSALQEGRKAAFTLRLDNYRHMRLRLACTLEDRSAQELVTEALDRFLAELPGLEDLARRAVTRN